MDPYQHIAWNLTLYTLGDPINYNHSKRDNIKKSMICSQKRIEIFKIINGYPEPIQKIIYMHYDTFKHDCEINKIISDDNLFNKYL